VAADLVVPMSGLRSVPDRERWISVNGGRAILVLRRRDDLPPLVGIGISEAEYNAIIEACFDLGLDRLPEWGDWHNYQLRTRLKPPSAELRS
jgi:hypothetical protein